jgi:hypothetical protein
VDAMTGQEAASITAAFDSAVWPDQCDIDEDGR